MGILPFQNDRYYRQIIICLIFNGLLNLESYEANSLISSQAELLYQAHNVGNNTERNFITYGEMNPYTPYLTNFAFNYYFLIRTFFSQ